MSVKTVSPREINISNHLIGSSLGKSEKETIARNIIILSRNNADEWLDFSFEEYQERCGHIVTTSEKDVLDEFVIDGILHFSNNKYHVTDKFIDALRKFIRFNPCIIKVGDELYRVFDEEHPALFDAEVIEIDDTLITCMVFVDQPRRMQFDRKTGVSIDGREYGWLEVKRG